MNNDIVKHGTTPADLLQMAVGQGADLDKLEKLMALNERWEANEARKAYHAAMAQFKAIPPKITKDSHVKFSTAKGVTEYNHASLSNVTNEINSELSKYGLNATWRTAQAEKQISVTCCITHILGHSESTSLSAYPDESGGKNPIQSIGSSVTYLERYTLLALTGLATHDQDNDGATATEFITPEQVETITDKLNKLSVKDKGATDRFLKYMDSKKVSTIISNDYGKATSALQGVK